MIYMIWSVHHHLDIRFVDIHQCDKQKKWEKFLYELYSIHLFFKPVIRYGTKEKEKEKRNKRVQW